MFFSKSLPRSFLCESVISHPYTTSESIPMMTPNENTRDAIEAIFPLDEGYAFLIGAGVSMNPPSSVPGARTIVKALLSFCVPEREVEPLANHPSLRYELLVEWIKILYDSELHFLEYLDLIQIPNIIHLYLAHAVEHKHVVITTNFDHLIEYGLKVVLPPEKYGQILPVITKLDFLANRDIHETFSKGLFPVVKIHGSRKNLITGQVTLDTLITTISSLGQGKEGTTFAIESHKKPLVYNALAGRVLVVMGYSGSDDFDITPVLMEVPFIKKLIWIEHDNASSPRVERIGTSGDDGKAIEAKASRTDQLLQALVARGEFEVIRVRCDTADLIKRWLWQRFYPSATVPETPEVAPGARPAFQQWIGPYFRGVTTPKQYYFAAQVYYYLKDLEATRRCCSDGLKVIVGSTNDDIAIKSQILNLLGNIEQIHSRCEDSLRFYLEAYELDQGWFRAVPDEGIREETRVRLGTDLNNIASVHIVLGKYRDALRYLRAGLTQTATTAVKSHEIALLNNIGRVHEIRNDYQAALAAYKAGLGVANTLGDLSMKMALLNNIGRIQLDIKKYDEARGFYEEADRISRELGDTYGQMILANNLARWAEETGDIESAKRELHRALDLATVLDDKAKRSGILSNLGLIALHAGDVETGLHNLEEALRIMKKIGDPQMLIAYLNNIGQVYDKLNDLPHAVQYYSEAYAKAREIQDNTRQALFLCKIGGIAIKNQDWTKAIELLEASTGLYEQVQDWKNDLSLLSDLALCYENVKDLGKAIEITERGVSISERLGNKVSCGEYCKLLGDFQDMTGQREKAVASYKRSIVYFEEAGQAENVEVVRKFLSSIVSNP